MTHPSEHLQVKECGLKDIPETRWSTLLLQEGCKGEGQMGTDGEMIGIGVQDVKSTKNQK